MIDLKLLCDKTCQDYGKSSKVSLKSKPICSGMLQGFMLQI